MSHPYRHFMDTIISKVSLTLKLITYIFGSCIDGSFFFSVAATIVTFGFILTDLFLELQVVLLCLKNSF